MPRAGLEPARPFEQSILSAPCLPFHHPGRVAAISIPAAGPSPGLTLERVARQLPRTQSTSMRSVIACDPECWGAARADRRHLSPHTTFFTTTHESHMNLLGAGRSNLHAPRIVGLGDPELDGATCTAHRDLTTRGTECAVPRTGGARNSR